MITAEELPGYREALLEEREAREFAFTGQPYSVAGIEVAAMTLAQLNTRLLIGCPFLHEQELDDEHFVIECARFLWHLSPGYLPSPQCRAVFVAEIAARPKEDLPALRAGIRDYIDAMFWDAPKPGPRKEGAAPPAACFAASAVDYLAREYRWSEKAILNLPLPRLYQYLREIRAFHFPDKPLPSRRLDKITGDYIRSLANPNSKIENPKSEGEAP